MPQESLADRLQYWARFTEQRQYAFAGHHPEGDMLRAVSIVLREAADRIEADAARIKQLEEKLEVANVAGKSL